MCKYGDLFLYLDIDDQRGISNCIGLPPQEIERLEGQDSTNPNYIQYQWNSAGMTFENWQVAHFRVLGNDKHSPYGTSIWTLRAVYLGSLRLLRTRWWLIELFVRREDCLRLMSVVFRQTISNNTWRKLLATLAPLSLIKRRVVLMATTFDHQEDYFIPCARVLLPMLQTSPVDKTPLLLKMLSTFVTNYSRLWKSQPYLSMGEGAAEDETTLAQKDIRFARTFKITSYHSWTERLVLSTLGFRGDVDALTRS